MRGKYTNHNILEPNTNLNKKNDFRLKLLEKNKNAAIKNEEKMLAK